MPPDPSNGGALGPADHGSTRQLARGEKLRLCLPEAPTSGYRWRGAEALDVGTTLRCVSSSYTPPAGGKAGGQGRRCWVFEARAAGSSTLHLQLTRPGDGPPAERFDLTIRVPA